MYKRQAVAIAEHVAGSEESFAELMNEKAEELGLGNTHFMNPSGLDNPEHYTTVYNLAPVSYTHLDVYKRQP